ncbi:MAG: prepilin peptidase [Rhizobiaceae bacterium]|nr:prepilin peptidase [Rhizobiaceae bacterium]
MQRQAGAAFAGLLLAVLIAILADIPPAAIGQLALLTSLMAAIAVTDFLTYRVPDWLVVATAVCGLGFVLAAGGASALLAAILRMALVGLVLFALREAYFRWRGFDGLGLGDIKLLAAAGAWIDLVGIANAVLIAALAALVAAGLIAAFRGWDGMRRLPFAAFLAPSIVAAWLAGLW